MRENHSTLEGRLVPALIAIFGVIAVLVVIDVIADVGEGAAFGHVIVEAGIGLAALLGVITLTWRVVGEARRARLTAETLSGDLESTRQAAAEWRTEAQGLIKGLGAQIDAQFSKWQLTGAEKEVALLLLKGFSHRDVARLRSVTEATARQQGRSIYTKAGVTGRHDLAGFFSKISCCRPRPSRAADFAELRIGSSRARQGSSVVLETLEFARASSIKSNWRPSRAPDTRRACCRQAATDSSPLLLSYADHPCDGLAPSTNSSSDITQEETYEVAD